MLTIETSTLVVLLLAAAAAGALITVILPWRRLMGTGHALPVWRFLDRSGASVEGRQALQAEMRCAMCESAGRCQQLLAEGAVTPPAGCPNAKIFGR